MQDEEDAMKNNAQRRDDYSQDNAPPADRPYTGPSEEEKRRIAQQAEEAVHIEGNINGPDLDDTGLPPALRLIIRNRSDFV